MPRTLSLLLALGCLAGAVARCGPSVDLGKALVVTDVFSGYYDAGVVEGKNKLVPAISFRLKNSAETSVGQVQCMVSFWQDGSDTDLDSRNVQCIGSEAVEPEASSPPVLVRSEYGYTLEQPRAELFSHSQFKDFTSKVFIRRGGNYVLLGEFTVERRILPRGQTATGQS